MKVKELVNKLQTKWIRIYIERKGFYMVEIFNASEDELNAKVESYIIEPYIGDNPEDVNCNMYIKIKENF